jgi:hypothetical protein
VILVALLAESVLDYLIGFREVKASHSADNNGNCVELAGASDRLVAVRDSKDPDGPVLLMEPSTLRAAVRAAISQTV